MRGKLAASGIKLLFTDRTAQQIQGMEFALQRAAQRLLGRYVIQSRTATVKGDIDGSQQTKDAMLSG